MSKKPIIGGIILAAIIGVIFVGAEINPDNPENTKIADSEVFHVRLANPQLYDDLYTHAFYSEGIFAEKGAYEFRFVASGDSPQKLSIKLLASSGAILMDEHFELEGTLIDDGISSWYTWDYLSKDNMLEIDESQLVEIFVSPNGNLKGTVSIGLVSIK